MNLSDLKITAPAEKDNVDLPLVLHTRVVTGEGGGPEKTILNSPRFLPELGYQSICAYMRPKGDPGFAKIRKRAEEWSAPLFEVDDEGPLDLVIFRRLLDFCREQKVAIWHGHDYKSNLIGLWVRRYWPMKLVTTVHGWVKFTWRTPLYYAIDRFCLRWYDRVICVSDDLHEACLKAGVRPQRCRWIENAIDMRQYVRSMNVRAAKQKLGLDPDRQLVGAVGRLSPEKGFDILIRSMAALRDVGLDVDLVIVGDGDQRQQLESLIASLGLTPRARLLGFRADTIDLFQAFDVFALSSLREGLPNVVLEAMAMETPVVATAIAGIPKLITDGVDGILVQPNDSSALSHALGQLCSDHVLSTRLATAARETIERRFSFQRRMERVANVYDELMLGAK
jgi:glycosyltransferase involved in cell wall biosynthesis